LKKHYLFLQFLIDFNCPFEQNPKINDDHSWNHFYKSGTTFFTSADSFRQELPPFEFELPPLEEFKIGLGNQPEAEYLVIQLINDLKYEAQIIPREIQREGYLLNHWQVSALRDQVVVDCESTFDFSEAVYFYAQNEVYGEFSNFADFGIELGGQFYPTVEHYYQAQKFEEEAYREKIRQAATPKEAADLGQTRDLPLRADWEEVKSGIMWQAVQQKFNSHYKLAQMLLATDQKLLIENSPYDEYWGIGSTGQGHNHLGTLLMRMRNTLKQS